MGTGLVFFLNLLALVWLILTWRKSGFLAALNLFAYGVLIGFGTVALLASEGRMVG